jgi:hypothetical protein
LALVVWIQKAIKYFFSIALLFQNMSTQFLKAAMKSNCNFKYTRAGKKLRHRFIQVFVGSGCLDSEGDKIFLLNCFAIPEYVY